MNIFDKVEIPNDPNTDDIFSLQETLRNDFDDLETAYKSFEKNAHEVIKNAQTKALQNISSDPVIIEDDLSDCVTVSYTLGAYIGEASSYLEYYTLIYYKGKCKELSEADRKLFMESKAFKQRRLINKLRILESKIDKKVGVMQSILKYETSRVMRER